MVEFIDGSTIAQASPPNMMGPIAYALGYPDRVASATKPINWSDSQTWNFAPIDIKRFPAIALAKHCGEIGGGAPAIYNAANEVAVTAFLDGRIGFTSIVPTVEKVVESLARSRSSIRDFSDVSAIEKDARELAHQTLMESA